MSSSNDCIREGMTWMRRYKPSDTVWDQTNRLIGKKRNSTPKR